MTNMFKKSVLAMALAGMSAGSMAATITSSEVSFSNEFLTNVPVVSASGLIADDAVGGDREDTQLSFTYTMKANYAINDTITFTFSSDAVSAASLPSEVSNEVQGAFAADDVVLSFISSEVVGTKLVATYRVSTIEAGVQSLDAEFDFEGINILPRKLTSALSVTYEAKTSTGLKLDNNSAATATGKLAKPVTQLAKLVADPTLVAVIDVDDKRMDFKVGGGDTNPSAEFEIDTATVAAVSEITATEVVYTITGDFAWLLDEDGAVEADVATVTADTCGDTDNVEVEADKVTITCSDLTSPEFAIDVEDDNEVVIPDQDFTVSAVVSYEVGSTSKAAEATFAAIDAGSWTLNGSKVKIPYMPYGTGITQVINLNNSGTQTGDITVEGFDRTGKAFGPIVVGQAAPGKQVALADAIATAVTTAVGSSERVSLTLVTNVPAADVTVYSAYNTGGNGARIVVNDSNGK